MQNSLKATPSERSSGLKTSTTIPSTTRSPTMYTLSNQPPAQYMEAVKKQIENQEYAIDEILGERELRENLKMNCVLKSIFGMDAGNYQGFLKERRKLMMEKARRHYHNL